MVMNYETLVQIFTRNEVNFFLEYFGIGNKDQITCARITKIHKSIVMQVPAYYE